MKDGQAQIKLRALTGGIMTLGAAAVLLLSHVRWVLRSVVALLSVFGVWEVYRAVGLTGVRWLLAVSLAAAGAAPFLPIPEAPAVTAVLFLGYVVLCAVLMLRVKEQNRIPGWCGIFLALCITMFFRAAVELRAMEQGVFLLTLPVLTCAVSDVAAYFVGRRFGKRKLAPVVSPHKTVAGFVGGTLVPVAVLLSVGLVLDLAGVLDIRFGILTVYLVLTALVGQFGDLALSAVKRISGIKDFASYFPGHGGVLDRCDSHLLAMAFTYLFVCVTGSWL